MVILFDYVEKRGELRKATNPTSWEMKNSRHEYDKIYPQEQYNIVKYFAKERIERNGGT